MISFNFLNSHVGAWGVGGGGGGAKAKGVLFWGFRYYKKGRDFLGKCAMSVC